MVHAENGWFSYEDFYFNDLRCTRYQHTRQLHGPCIDMHVEVETIWIFGCYTYMQNNLRYIHHLLHYYITCICKVKPLWKWAWLFDKKGKAKQLHRVEVWERKNSFEQLWEISIHEAKTQHAPFPCKAQSSDEWCTCFKENKILVILSKTTPHQLQKSKQPLICFCKQCKSFKSCSPASIDAIPDRRPSIFKDLDDTRVLLKVERTSSCWGMINTNGNSISSHHDRMTWCFSRLWCKYSHYSN